MSDAELILDHTELTRLSVTCGQCGTILIFDVSGAAQPEPRATPSTCPGCSNEFPDLAGLVEAYRLFHDRIARSDLSVTFRTGLPR